MLKLKKFPAVIIVLILGICLNSCGGNRVAFGPETGVYEIMLDEDAWEIMDSQSARQLWLLHEAQGDMSHGVWLTIDYHKKSDIASLSAPDFDSFIKLYKTFSTVMDIYENENNAVQDLLEIEPRDMRGGSAVYGKRQQIFINVPDHEAITEYIFLETDDYYFAMYYGAETDTFSKAQDIVNDVIKNLRVLEKE